MRVCYLISDHLDVGEHVQALERTAQDLTLTVVDATNEDEWGQMDAIDCVLYHDTVSPQMIETIRSEWPDVPFIRVIAGEYAVQDEPGHDVKDELRPVDDWVFEDRLVDGTDLIVARLRRTIQRAREVTRLRRRAAFLSNLLEETSDVVTIVDESGVIRYQSPSTAGLLGYDRAELLDEDVFEYIHPEDVDHTAEVMFDVVTTEEERTGRAVFRFRHEDGSWIDLQGVCRSLSIDAPDGEVINACEIVVSSQDGTEAKDTTGELASMRDQLRVILNNTPAVVYMKDLDQRYRYVNPSFERFSGHPREEVLGNRTEDVLPATNAEQIEEMDREALEREAPVKHVEDFRFDGERRVFFNVRVPLFDDDGDPYAIFGIATEMTERKEREESMQALVEAGPQLQACETVEAIGSVAVSVTKSVLDQPISAVLIDDERAGVFRSIAETAEATDLLGESLTIERGSGIVWQVFTTGELYASSDVTADSEAYNPNSAIESELIVPLNEHGVLLACSTEPRAFDDHDIEFAMILGAMIQGTIDRIDRERQLRTENRRLEEFAGIIAHDLRNPLAVAKGYAELARETGNVDYLSHVEEGVDRATSIVEGLLALARSRQGIDEFEEGTVDQVARDAWSSIVTPDASLRIETDRAITADFGWLQQLFENAFRNAIEHGGSDVTVRVGSVDDGFYIEDDGPGIEPELRERLLQGAPSEGDVRFGFRIIREVVDAHSWHLSIEEGDRGGTRLVITGVR